MSYHAHPCRTTHAFALRMCGHARARMLALFFFLCFCLQCFASVIVVSGHSLLWRWAREGG